MTATSAPGVYPELMEAVRELAKRCDGARYQDGAGFSKYDAPFGLSLAKQDHWSAKQASAAHRMVRHYRRQLLRCGVDYDRIPEPDVVEVRYDAPPAAPVASPGEAGSPGAAVTHERTVQFNGSLFALKFEYHPQLLAGVRAIPGRRFDGNLKVWTVPLAGWQVMDEWAVQNQFSYSPKAAAAISELKLRTEASTAVDADVHIPTLKGELRPFQRAGVAYAMRAKRLFIADEMGLGKTVQALATLEGAEAFPALIVCPASLKLNWAREAKMWIPHRSVDILSGRQAENPLFYGFMADISIVNYDVLAAREEDLAGRGYKAVVFDECHALKTPKAQRSKAALAIAKDRPYRIMLSGTPLLNRPGELITQLRVLDRLEDMGGWSDFNKRYLGAAGTTPLQELNRRLRAVCYVRRLKKQVLTELPAKQRTIVPFDLTNRREYEYAQEDLIRWLREREGNEVADKAERAEVLVRISKLRMMAAQGKLKGVGEWVSNFLDSGSKLVLFAHHREIQAELIRQHPGCAQILGEDPMPMRQANVDRFQGDPSCRLIVCSLKAAGVGITLTAASNVAFVEQGWNMAEMAQAEDRCHRIGQQDSVTSWWLLAQNTIDDMISELILSKAAVVDAATEGHATEDTQILGNLIGRLLVA